jgi:hypothetical protein
MAFYRAARVCGGVKGDAPHCALATLYRQSNAASLVLSLGVPPSSPAWPYLLRRGLTLGVRFDWLPTEKGKEKHHLHKTRIHCASLRKKKGKFCRHTPTHVKRKEKSLRLLRHCDITSCVRTSLSVAGFISGNASRGAVCG